MSRLVSDLLLLARADAGRLDAHRRCDLAEVAGDAAAEAAPLLGDRELQIDNDRPLRVEGNPDELHRMVLNLLDNAARHTPPGATIELGLRARRTATRWSKSPTTAPASPPRMREPDLRPLRPRRGPRRHRRRHRHRPRPGDRQRRRRPPTAAASKRPSPPPAAPSSAPGSRWHERRRVVTGRTFRDALAPRP